MSESKEGGAAPEPVEANPIRIVLTDDAHFSADGLEVVDPSGVLVGLGFAEPSPLFARLPAIEPGGVQEADTGVIQDPAGSAIGGGKDGLKTAGGASGAIYDAFPDLEGIPTIDVGGAVFNSSRGPGARVLHTFSPRLAGKPGAATERAKALEDISNAYANAILAFNRHAGVSGGHGGRLNLVPVSAAIFAGNFANPRFTHPHLDPSYTLTAVAIAIGTLSGAGDAIPDLSIYYYSPDVRAAAEALVSSGGVFAGG